jgi:hypothetical protein
MSGKNATPLSSDAFGRAGAARARRRTCGGGGGVPANFFLGAWPPPHRTVRSAEKGEAHMMTEDRLPPRWRLRRRSREQGRPGLPLRRGPATASLLPFSPSSSLLMGWSSLPPWAATSPQVPVHHSPARGSRRGKKKACVAGEVPKAGSSVAASSPEAGQVAVEQSQAGGRIESENTVAEVRRGAYAWGERCEQKAGPAVPCICLSNCRRHKKIAYCNHCTRKQISICLSGFLFTVGVCL